MSKFTAISGALALGLSLSACAVTPYVPGPNAVIATDNLGLVVFMNYLILNTI